VIRKLLDAPHPQIAVACDADAAQNCERETADGPTCPCCGGIMVVIEILPGPRRHARRPTLHRNDTS
jgi:hypothetical protein